MVPAAAGVGHRLVVRGEGEDAQLRLRAGERRLLHLPGVEWGQPLLPMPHLPLHPRQCGRGRAAPVRTTTRVTAAMPDRIRVSTAQRQRGAIHSNARMAEVARR